MAGPLDDGPWNDFASDGPWTDAAPTPAPAQKTIGQMRAEMGPIQDLKAPSAPIGRTGDGSLGDIFASFMEHWRLNDANMANDENAAANLLRTQIGTTPILNQRQTENIRKYNEATPFWEEPSVGEQIAGGVGSVGGMLTGSLRDPTSIIGGVGKTVANTFLKNAGLSAASDALSQLFSKDLPTVYDPNSEVYNKETGEFDTNGPAYVAPGFDVTRSVMSGLAGGGAATVLSGQAYKALSDAIESVARSDSSIFDNFISGLAEARTRKPAAPGAAPQPDAPAIDPYANIPESVRAVLQANNIAPDDPRFAEVAAAVQQRLAASAARVVDAPKESVSGAFTTPQAAREEVERDVAMRRQMAESRAAVARGETPEVDPGFDPRPQTSLLPPTIALGQSRPLANGAQGTIARGAVDDALTSTGRGAVAGMDAAGLTPLTREEKMAVLDRYGYVPDNMEQARKLYSNMTGNRPVQTSANITSRPGETIAMGQQGPRGTRAQGEAVGELGAIREGQMQANGQRDLTTEQTAELFDAWGFVPETVETRLKAYKSLQAEKARQAEADAKGAMRVSDTSGEGRTSPRSRPMDRGVSATDQGDFEETLANRTPRTQSASGNGDRPFRANDTGSGNEGSGNIEFDLMRAAREGNPEAGFRERTKAEDFEARARESVQRQRMESEEDLMRFWEQEKQRRARDNGERQRYEQRQEQAKQRHEGKASSTKEKGFDADGRFEVDENGFVLSDKGGPIIFGDQKQAAKWILKAQRESLDQNFEIHNHPTKANSFTAREFSRTAKSGASGRTDNAAGGNARAESAGPEQSNRSEQGAGAGNARLSEGVSDDGGTAGPRGEAGGARESAEGASGQTEPLRIEQRRVAETPERRAFETAKAELEKAKSDLKAAQDKAAADKKAAPKPATKAATAKEKADADAAAKTRRERVEQIWREVREVRQAISESGAEMQRLREQVEVLSSEKTRLEAKSRKTAKDRARLSEVNGDINRAEDRVLDAEAELSANEDRLTALLAEEKSLTEPELPFAEGVKAKSDSKPADGADVAKLKEAVAAKEAKLKDMKAAADAADAKAKADFKEEGKPKPGIPEGAKNPNAPIVESFFGFDKRPISADDLTEDGYPKSFGEPDMKPQAKSGNKTTKFYSNPFGDPDIWKPILKDLGKLFSAARRGLGQLRQRLRDSSFLGWYTTTEDFLRFGVYSNPGLARTFIDRYRNMGNEEVAKGLDKIFSRMYTRPGEGGKTGITRESWAEAVEPVVNQWANRVGNLLDPIAKRGDAALKKFADDYQYRGVFSPEDAKIAYALTKVMNEFRDTMNKRLKAISDERIKSARTVAERKRMEQETADLQIGFVKNYLPRMLDMQKLLANGAEERFIKAATREYMRQHGLSKEDAELSAMAYYNNASGTSFVSHVGSTTRADTMKSRVFEARRDSGLNEFYIDNPVESIYSYMLNTVRSVAHMERFGVNNEVLDRELTDLTKLGLAKHDRDYLRYALNSSMGNIPTTLPLAVEQMAGMARMYGAIRFLDQSTLASLMEPLSVAARSGNVMDAVKSMYLTVRQIAKKGDAEELRNFTEALGITTSAFNDSMMANKFMGTDLTTRWQRRLSMNFFKQIGLTQLTHATRQASTQLGTYFILKQLRNFSTGRAKESARQALAELGIEEKMVKPIMDMLSDNDGLPPLAKIMADTPEAKAYRVAVTRFVNETIMNPTAADRPGWANSSFGALCYGIASFQAAFTRNVLFRTAKQVGGAIGGVARGEMNALDFYNRAVGPVIGLGLLSYAQGMAGYMRDQLNNPEQAAQRTDEQNALLMFSRAGLFGNLDKFINGVYGVKYGQDIKNIFVGPVISTLFRDATNIGKAAIDDNPNTNTDEWKATKSAYEATVPFLIGGMVTAASTAPLPVRAGLGIWLLSPFSPGAPQTAVEVANEVAGKRTTKQFRDDKPNKGLFSEMPSLVGSANAAEVPPPAKAARKRKYVISRDADGNLIAGTGNSTYLIRRDKSGRIEVEER